MTYNVIVPVRGLVTVTVEASDETSALVAGIDLALCADTGDIESMVFDSDTAKIELAVEDPSEDYDY